MTTSPRALTRQQRYMTLALDHIGDVFDRYKDNEQLRTIYGGLAHSFPVVVRTCGLCQALAFVESKAAGKDARATAYQLLRRHVAAALDLNEGALLTAVRSAPVADYMRFTRTLLDAWIFYKRFAVSILKVESAQAGEDARQ